VIVEESAKAWKFVWIAACFLKSVEPMMNEHVESALEDGKVREGQLS
jgi:hypothetical protein